MNQKNLLCSLAVGMIAASNINAQVSTAFNTGASTDFVGWASGQNFDLPIAHKGTYNINFSTSGSQRATILSNGNFGIGTTSPAASDLSF